MTSTQCGVLEAPAPAFSAERAAEFAREIFGVIGRVEPLGSERDQNFRIRPAPSSDPDDPHSASDPGYVLKISNQAEDPAVLDLQQSAFSHVVAVEPELAIPRLHPTLDGARWRSVPGADGANHSIWLLSYLPGRQLADVRQTARLRHNLGSAIARLARALRGFFHPAAGRELMWDLGQASKLRPHLEEISDPARRQLAEPALDRFDARADSSAPPESNERMIARRSRLLGPAYSLFYDRPLQIVRGEGVWLYDETGRRYLDAYNNVAHVGHGHPHVVDAIAEQARTLNTNTRYLNDKILEYFNTFGGNPVSCAAGLAVLDVLDREGLQDNAQRVGKYLKTKRVALGKSHAAIGDVRGAGLFIGVDLVRDRETREPAPDLARRVADGMREAGVLIGIDGPAANVLKIRPPMPIQEAHADLLVDALDAQLERLSRGHAASNLE